MILYDLPERLLSPESDPVTMIFRNDSWVTQTTVTQLKFLGPTNTFYSLHTQNNWRLGQRYRLKDTTFISYFSKNIYQKVIYIYIYFYKNIFQDKSILYFLHFQTQQLESFLWFIFSRFDSNLVQNINYFEYGVSTLFFSFMLELGHPTCGENRTLAHIARVKYWRCNYYFLCYFSGNKYDVDVRSEFSILKSILELLYIHFLHESINFWCCNCYLSMLPQTV